MNRLQHLHRAGVSIWLDDLSRDLLDDGVLARLIQDLAVTGATSNPTIFAKAIADSNRYDPQIRDAIAVGTSDPHEIFFELALEDVRRGADMLRAVYELSGGSDGFVSFECTPDLADDAEATVKQALEIRDRVDVPNLLIKVAATDAGITAIEELTAIGVSVNVTLLFSVRRSQQALGAYWRGLERRAGAGKPLGDVFSVASFFVSRVDAAVDPRLAVDSPLRGRIAIANAEFAYVRYLEVSNGPLWKRLAAKGARPQRPLWASTGTKDRTYSDVRYVQELIAPGVINTMPLETLLAFLGHGDVGASMGADRDGPKRLLAELAEVGVDLLAITEELEKTGVNSFRDSYGELLTRIEAKANELSVDTREQAHV